MAQYFSEFLLIPTGIQKITSVTSVDFKTQRDNSALDTLMKQRSLSTSTCVSYRISEGILVIWFIYFVHGRPEQTVQARRMYCMPSSRFRALRMTNSSQVRNRLLKLLKSPFMPDDNIYPSTALHFHTCRRRLYSSGPPRLLPNKKSSFPSRYLVIA